MSVSATLGQYRTNIKWIAGYRGPIETRSQATQGSSRSIDAVHMDSQGGYLVSRDWCRGAIVDTDIELARGPAARECG
jgi:hypothetical protein